LEEVEKVEEVGVDLEVVGVDLEEVECFSHFFLKVYVLKKVR
jgi:hypothetical protein